VFRTHRTLHVFDDSLPLQRPCMLEYVFWAFNYRHQPMILRFRTKAKKLVRLSLLMLGAMWAVSSFAQQDSGSAGTAKAVGTIKAISENKLTIMTEAASSMTVMIQDSTRMIRTAPGAKDLKDATSVVLQDLQAGDRVLVRGRTAEDGKSLLASSLIVIKAGDVAAKQQQEREDWRKRGTGGLVTAVDARAGTITISNSPMGGNKATTIHVSKDTIVRRYAPDSIKFDDARPGTVDQIKMGDQLRARGTRSADGSEMAAEEIVSGTFRNIAGTVISTDGPDNSITVRDLATKNAVTLKINPDSQLRSLPPMIAQRIAARLKGPPAGAAQGAPTAATAGQPGGQGSGGQRSGGAPDFQQMLNRMPAVAISDLQKGAAVMIVATEGGANSQPTAVTLLTGVEDILSASPDSSRAAMLLSPWNLGGVDAAAANQ
jgi:Domain of unknown function (DUF5666)